MASIFSRMGYDGLFFARLDYQDKANRLRLNTTEMIWQGSPNLGKSFSRDQAKKTLWQTPTQPFVHRIIRSYYTWRELLILTYWYQFTNPCIRKFKILYTKRDAHKQGWQIYVE